MSVTVVRVAFLLFLLALLAIGSGAPAIAASLTGGCGGG
jgi:hypothetical protein